MIRKLQRRFIRIALVSLTVAMVLVVAIVNIANWISVWNELSDTLSFLVEDRLPPAGDRRDNQELPLMMNEADQQENTTSEAPQIILTDNTSFINENAGQQEDTEPDDSDKLEQTERSDSGKSDESADSDQESDRRRAFFQRMQGNGVPGFMNGRSRQVRNIVTESTWLAAAEGEDGEMIAVQMDERLQLTEEEAKALAKQALSQGSESGLLQDYLYQVATRTWDNHTIRAVVMLNVESRLTTARTLVFISAFACAGGVLLAWLLVWLFSRRAVEPTIHNMEQQKVFITNASHELKTPITVISTNMELLQMEHPGNQWVRSTQKQTAAMRHLVDELVYLSRMEEEYPTLNMETLNPGALLRETAEPFVAMAEFNGMEMRVETEPDLHMTGDRASIQRLISTLCENAVKYASDGPILAEAHAEGKNILLRISNPVAEPMTKEQCLQLFNRFYRADHSRNKGKQSGFGIGLAIAAAIAEKHGGSVSAAMLDANRLAFTCVLPKDQKK